jgi:AraC-like DNA-binding protein
MIRRPTTMSIPDALDFPRFRTAVSESFVPLEVRTDHPDRFLGSIRNVEADEVHFSIVSANQHTVERTPRLVRASTRRYFKLGVQLQGTGLLVQGARETLLQPGSLAIYDTDRPYSLAFDGDFRSLVVMFPIHLVDLPLEAVEQLTATPLDRSGGIGPLIVPHLANLAENLQLLAGPGGARLTRNTVDLVVTMLSNELALGRVEVSPRQRLFTEITQFIDENLRSPDLSPGRIASEHFISPRHLNALFHDNEATVSTWVRRRRLEECRQRLLDPAFDSRSITSIAGEWGFADAAHFSRAFRAEFGCSPREARAGR